MLSFKYIKIYINSYSNVISGSKKSLNEAKTHIQRYRKKEKEGTRGEETKEKLPEP